jgi:hypothetical protein
MNVTRRRGRQYMPSPTAATGPEWSPTREMGSDTAEYPSLSNSPSPPMTRLARGVRAHTAARGLQSSTLRLNVNRFCGICWAVSVSCNN